MYSFPNAVFVAVSCCLFVGVTSLYELSISVDQSLSGNLTAFKLVKQFCVLLWKSRVRCGYTIGDVVLRR